MRTDNELECSHIDKTLLEKGCQFLMLPDDVDEERLERESRDYWGRNMV